MIFMKGTKVHIRKKSLKLSTSFLFTLNGTSVHYEIDIFLKKKKTKQHNLLFWLKKPQSFILCRLWTILINFHGLVHFKMLFYIDVYRQLVCAIKRICAIKSSLKMADISVII